MKKRILRVAAVVVCSMFLFSSPGFAAGFRLPDEQGASAFAMASAFVGQADDPTAVWFNPAGITQLDGTRIAGGVFVIYPIAKHENDTINIGTTDVSDRKLHLPVHLYATHKMNDRLTLGLGVNNPFGLSTDWDPQNSSTRYVSTFSKVITINVNPNVAYKLSDNLSVAVGIDYLMLRATMEKIIFIGADANFRLNGDGDGWGANVGVHYKATNQLNFGLTYRSRIKIDVDGRADIGGGAIASDPGHTEITLPDLIQFGASYKATDNLTLNADIDYTMWSTYDRLVIQSNAFILLGEDTITEEKQWKDVPCLRIGGQYKLSDHWKLRAGYLYDWNPVPEERFETSVPDSDRQGITIGAGYTSGNITIDAAYQYLRFNKRTITNSLNDELSPLGIYPATYVNALNGAYKSQAHTAGFTIGYKF